MTQATPSPAADDATEFSGELSWIVVLDQADAWRRLRQEPVGRVAFIEGARPHVLPLNFAVEDHSVVFRTATLFSKTPMPMPVSFEVDSYDRDTETGWSVVVHGELVRVTADDEVGACERTGLLGWAPGERNDWYRIVPARVTGRIIGRRRHATNGGFVPSDPPA